MEGKLMNKKQIVDLVIAIFLIVCGSVLLLFPLFIIDDFREIASILVKISAK